MNLAPYLNDLQNRIDDAQETQLLQDWKRFAAGKADVMIFRPVRVVKPVPGVVWPAMSINTAQQSVDNMIYHQLRACSGQLEAGTGMLMNVRANYGTGIMPTLFGAELFWLDDELNTLPTTKPLAGGRVAIDRLIAAGVPDIMSGRGKDVLAFYQRFNELAADYPLVKKHVHPYHPDLQGPMDVCELLWGSGLFMDLFDVPDTVHAMLKIITETYTAFMREIEKHLPAYEGTTFHWGGLIKGRLMLRDDSAMNLSPEMFREFIAPYDNGLLKRFGGGSIHFCGRGDHYIEQIGNMEYAYGIQMSQPEYNDMEVIWRNTVDKGKGMFGFPAGAAEAAVAGGRDLRGRVHVW